MASYYPNDFAGLHPITSAVVGLGRAMFDPTTAYKKALGDSQMAVDQAQIANYGANSRKLDSETLLNSQKLGGRGGISAAFADAMNPDGTLNRAKIGALAGRLSEGDQLGELGNVLSQVMLSQSPTDPAFVDNAAVAMMRQGKTPDMNFAPTAARGDQISARDAGEDFNKAVTVQGMQDATSRANNSADNVVKMDIANLNDGTRNRIADALDTRVRDLAADKNKTALDIAGGRNTVQLQIAGLSNTTKTDIAAADRTSREGIAAANNTSRETIAANKPKTFNEVKGQLAQQYLDTLPDEQLAKLAQDLIASEDNPDPAWTLVQDEAGAPFMYDAHSANPVAVPVPMQGGGALGPVTKVGTPQAAAKPVTINASQSQNLADRVSAAFSAYDVGTDQLVSDVENRAFEIYQQGDAATNTPPGNPAAAVSAAFAELVDVQEDSWGAMGTPNAMPRTAGAPVAAPAAAPAAPAPAAIPDINQARAEAQGAIAKGADPAAVAARFKEVYGVDF